MCGQLDALMMGLFGRSRPSALLIPREGQIIGRKSSYVMIQSAPVVGERSLAGSDSSSSSSNNNNSNNNNSNDNNSDDHSDGD